MLTREQRELLEKWAKRDWALDQAIKVALDTIDEQTYQLAQCYRLSGADPDGNEDWRLALGAVQAVRELRESYDEVCGVPEPRMADEE